MLKYLLLLFTLPLQAHIIIQVPLITPHDITPQTQIPATIYTNNGPVKALIASSNWDQIHYTSLEEKLGYFNLLDHLSEIIPSYGLGIALIISGNGIQTKYKDFHCFSTTLRKQLPHTPLHISLYNPTEGIQKDLARALQLQNNIENTIITQTRDILSTLLPTIHHHNPQARILYIAHSEGGGIFTLAHHTPLAKKTLLYIGLAPSIPTPKTHLKAALNIYSDQDGITLPLAAPYQNDPAYDIHITPSITPKHQQTLYLADHSFHSPTYQKALQALIHSLQNTYGFYN